MQGSIVYYGVSNSESSELKALCDQAIDRYGVRALDNIDLSRLDGLASQARVLGRALMERGDARAFVLGRRMLAMAGV